MKLYADSWGRRALQIVTDLLFVLWVVLWVQVAGTVHDVTMELAGPGRATDSAATSLSGHLRDAGGTMGDLPVVGDRARAPFDSAAGASEQLAAAGRASVDAVERLAFWLRLVTAAIPILVVGAFYLPLRWRFVRRASAGQRFVDANEDLDLFALRALANQPMHVLARIDEDPAGAWRRRDRSVVRKLAELELRDSGLRLPRLPEESAA